MEATVLYHKDIPMTELGNGSRRKVLAHTDDLMIVEVHCDDGGVGPAHKHPHTQCTYVKCGRFRFTADGREIEVGEGDSIAFPPNVEHGTLCLEAGILVDVFTPARQDFLK